MNTRDKIIEVADTLLRTNGYNDFSYKDISAIIGIKTASIHYHFPTKTDLGIAIIQAHADRLQQDTAKLRSRVPLERLERFIQYYYKLSGAGQVCVVGAFASDLGAVDENIRLKLNDFMQQTANWIREILEDGQADGTFHLNIAAQDKAVLIITNLMGLAQIARVGYLPTFEQIKSQIINEIRK